MSTKQEAIELIGRIHACRPKHFFSKIDNSTRGSNFILFYLQRADHETIAGELAKELDVSTARIASLLKTMEKNGLIERSHSSADARQTVVRLTPAGNAAAEQIKEQILEKTMLLIDVVGKEDLDEFIRISNRIRDALGE